MKRKITNLTQALTYTLEGMYDSEKKIQKELPELISMLTQGGVTKMLTEYLDASRDKRQKLKRIFSYLLAGPFGKKSLVTKKAFEEINEAIKLTSRSRSREILVVSSFASIVQYRLTTYALAADMSAHMDLDPVAEILDEIISWEKQSVEALKRLETKKVGQLQKESLIAL
jgi:ferritin-like metal-binding protein YciE